MNLRTGFVVILLGIRFVLELCLLVAVSVWGFSAEATLTSWVLGIAAPILVAVTWGVFVAPKATVELPLAARLLIELALFGIAALGLWTIGRESLAIALMAAELLTVALLSAVGRPPGTT